MLSAFYQSLSGLQYSVLLLAESLIALYWGIRSRSRVYVQIALGSLILNGLAQFGPGFAAHGPLVPTRHHRRDSADCRHRGVVSARTAAQRATPIWRMNGSSGARRGLSANLH